MGSPSFAMANWVVKLILVPSPTLLSHLCVCAYGFECMRIDVRVCVANWVVKLILVPSPTLLSHLCVYVYGFECVYIFVRVCMANWDVKLILFFLPLCFHTCVCVYTWM